MNYQSAIDYIYGGMANTKSYSLEKIRLAAEKLGNPQDNYKIIHIAGTNGKGSVCNMVFSVLKNAGKKVGIFTSPHLIDIKERFRTNGGEISENELIEIIDKISALGMELAFFEICTLIAFEFFKIKNCEYAVIEVGVGGLLDSTNIINPFITCITSIGYDHMEILGKTLEEISFQKAGIIKPGVPAVINIENKIIQKTASANNAQIIFTDELKESNMIGVYQKKNAALAFEICKYLGISEELINNGLQKVIHKGRMEYLFPNLLIEGAHNDDGLEFLKDYIKTLEHQYDEIFYCVGLKKGKNFRLIYDKFGIDEKYIFVDYHHTMIERVSNLILQSENISYQVLSPQEIIENSQNNPKSLYIVFGSLYMIGGFYGTDIDI